MFLLTLLKRMVIRKFFNVYRLLAMLKFGFKIVPVSP